MATKLALLCAEIALTSVLYVCVYVREIRTIQKTCVHYALKFVKRVLKNVQNMPLTTKAVKRVLKLAKNVQRLAHN